MGRRISGRVDHLGAPASSENRTLRGRAAPVTVLLLVLTLTVVAVMAAVWASNLFSHVHRYGAQ